MTPERTEQREYRCCCRLREMAGNGKVRFDACPAIVSGPDEPICSDCLMYDHPELPNFDPRIPTCPTK